MKTTDLIRQLKCIHFDKTLNEKCRHSVMGNDHKLLVQQMIEHANEAHPGLEVDPKKLESLIEPVED